MAHFAQLNDDDIVIQVIVVNNSDTLDSSGVESEAVGIAFCQSLFPNQETRWAQTSYNGNFRKNYAGIGSVYDAMRDAFISPIPYPSWVLNENKCQWGAPIPYPDDGKTYYWDEGALSWIGRQSK